MEGKIFDGGIPRNKVKYDSRDAAEGKNEQNDGLGFVRAISENKI
jgi:hypothetical protein